MSTINTELRAVGDAITSRCVAFENHLCGRPVKARAVVKNAGGYRLCFMRNEGKAGWSLWFAEPSESGAEGALLRDRSIDNKVVAVGMFRDLVAAIDTAVSGTITATRSAVEQFDREFPELAPKPEGTA